MQSFSPVAFVPLANLLAEIASKAESHWHYWAVITLMMTGLYIVISSSNLVKKIIGLNIFQVSVIMLYVSTGKIEGATPPILLDSPDIVYSNPVPHVLMLTAIVVGVATTALGLALVVRIKEAYGTTEEEELLAIDQQKAKEWQEGSQKHDGRRIG